MRTFFAILGLVMVFSFISPESSVTKKEKKFALNYMKQTRQRLLDDVKGLSENQLKWKPADSAWSIAECIEHITISEKNLLEMVKGSLAQPADPSKRSEIKNTDEGVIKILTNRSFKVKTQEPFKPTGQFGDAWKTLEVYKERRGNLIDYTKSSKEDLRNHYIDLPFGKIDTYQGLLFIAAHCERHTLQIEEVKSNPGFPK